MQVRTQISGAVQACSPAATVRRSACRCRGGCGMAYNYEFKYPRRKLHEIVGRYLAQMHTMGRAANCGVFFVEQTYAGPDVRGWLLKHRDGGEPGDRYVLLEDGDVWIDPDGPRSVSGGAGAWLNAPTDDLAVLLAQSLKSARMGGDGLLVSDETVPCQVVVEDRRETMQVFTGREKRIH
jgi:hypothetical protein